LYKIGQAGPEAMTSVKSAAGGKFEMPDTVQGGPHLLQTAFSGVTYNKMLPPGRPTTDLSVDVFNTSPKPDQTRVTTHMILLEPNGMKLQVNESIIWRNGRQDRLLRREERHDAILLPPGSGGKARVNCTAPQGMPIERPAVKTKTQGHLHRGLPVKPGETRFDILYEIPMTGPWQLHHESCAWRRSRSSGRALRCHARRRQDQAPRQRAQHAGRRLRTPRHRSNGRRHRHRVPTGTRRAKPAPRTTRAGKA
jgi:hypothetical protein